ncbi:hypothetical protein GUITHDRAFT_149310, partial [Guillardia theta CCMP2712]
MFLDPLSLFLHMPHMLRLLFAAKLRSLPKLLLVRRAHREQKLRGPPTLLRRLEALAFKVMRLNRPSFHQAGFTAGLQALRETASDQAEQATGHLPHSDAEGCPSENLLLPTGFGNIYLGETFTAYISACNTSGSRLMRLEIRAEIQTGTKRVPLLDGKPETVLAQFESNQQVDYIVSHELKEAGVHIMICSGSYLDASGEEKKVRQYFKFQ